jgi:DNA repair exonuclease SbcCD ATPase subunit
MSSPPQMPEIENLVRFLNRFADLMSIGSNADHLLRAAQLLEISSKRARDAEALLREQCNKSATQLAFSNLLEANCDVFENEIAGLKSEIAQLHATFNEALIDAARENADVLLRAEQAETELAAIQSELSRDVAVGDDHVLAPLSLLRLAQAQFNALARDFQKSGNIVSQVMCEASASTLNRIVEADAPPTAARQGTTA